MTDESTPAETATSSTSARHAPLPPRNKRDRRYWLAALSLVLALVAGIVIGAGGAIVYIDRKTHPKRPRMDEFTKMMLARMDEQITLTPDEKTAVEGILRVRFQQMEKLREEFRDEIRDQFDDMSGEVKGIVGAERYKKWEEYRNKQMDDKQRPRRNRGKNAQ